MLAKHSALTRLVFARPATASFSRKTKRNKKTSGLHDDEAFSPPPNSEKADGTEDQGAKKGSHNKVYIPEVPLVFKDDNSMLIFEVSENFKKLPRFTVPTYFLSFASAVVMMDAFTTMAYFKGVFFTVPFLTFLGLSTYMN